jgi:single-stranded DNA-binding protein
MNRVVLCGRLEGRPTLAYTTCGVPVAQFRLLVPRDGLFGGKNSPDRIDCVAFGDVAERLNFWGEPGHRVNLEGALRPETYQVQGRQLTGARVHSDRAYFVDPVTDKPLPGPSRTPEALAKPATTAAAPRRERIS